MRLTLLIVFLLGACRGDETLTAYGAADKVWRLTEMNGTAVTTSITLQFPEPESLRGDAPCNSYSGAQTAPYPWFKAERVLSTRRACPDLPLETDYFASLNEMQIAEVSGDTLILSNEAKHTLVFTAE